jgi:hypothetical protein
VRIRVQNSHEDDIVSCMDPAIRISLSYWAVGCQTALHNALSIGLHSESDAKCPEAAHDVRLVLTELIERMSLLRKDNSELQSAVQRLIAKRGEA